MVTLAHTFSGRSFAAPSAVASAPAPHRSAKRTRRVAPTAVASWLGRAAANVVTAVSLLGFLGLAVGPHLFGYQTLTMLTASMAPVIEPGDVTVVTPLPVEDVAAGMILTYQIPVEDRRVVSHRVTEVTREDGRTTIQTRGDANPGLDPWEATLDGDTAYQVRAVVPAAGDVIRLVRTPGLQQALLYGAPALLVASVLVSVWRPRNNED